MKANDHSMSDTLLYTSISRRSVCLLAQAISLCACILLVGCVSKRPEDNAMFHPGDYGTFSILADTVDTNDGVIRASGNAEYQDTRGRRLYGDSIEITYSRHGAMTYATILGKGNVRLYGYDATQKKHRPITGAKVQISIHHETISEGENILPRTTEEK